MDDSGLLGLVLSRSVVGLAAYNVPKLLIEGRFVVVATERAGGLLESFNLRAFMLYLPLVRASHRCLPQDTSPI